MPERRLRPWTAVLALAALAMLGACRSLLPQGVAPPALHVLTPLPLAAVAGSRGPGRWTLLVSPPGAGPGFDSRRMVYSDGAGRLAFFANHEWVDTPARMLAPWLVHALAEGGAFRAVVPAGSAGGELRLETAITEWQQLFGAGAGGSVFRLRIRAVLVDTGNRRVIGAREFAASAAARSEDAAGGVAAASEALNAALAAIEAYAAGLAAAHAPAPEAPVGRPHSGGRTRSSGDGIG